MKKRKQFNPTLWLSLAGLALLYWWTFSGLDIGDVNIMKRLPQGAKIIQLMFGEMDPAYWPKVQEGLLESFQMTVIATALGAVLAVPFGFWAARNLSKLKWIPATGKFSLSFIRTFPELLLAIIIFRGVGPGALAGILTMAIHSIGMLGKLYGEVIESIDRGPMEAMKASGATGLQMIRYGVLPQVLPEFVSFAIYRFEINMRAASILGIVGAGGIGQPLIFGILNRDWGKVGLILVGIIAVVSVIDYASMAIRRRLV